MITATPAQQRAIETNSPCLVIIAGPGSGKTFVIVERIAHMVRGGVDPNTIAVVTFTNAAAAELARRLAALLPDTKLGYVGTIHGLCLRMLEANPLCMGYRPNIAVIDDQQSAELLADTADLTGFNKLSKGSLAAAHARLGTFAGVGPQAESVVVGTYYRRLRQSNAIDFHGLLTEAHKLLLLVGDAAHPYSHLLVDEYHDVAERDVNVFREMHTSTLTMVGDPDQGIYSWRGGNVQQLLDASLRYAAETVILETNFRCAPNICTAAQNLIAHNKARMAAKRTTPAATTPAGYVEFMGEASDDMAEAVRLCEHIQQYIASGAKPTDIAVLARTNAVVNQLRNVAAGYNFPIEKPAVDPEAETAGWQYARLTVEMLAAPDNELVLSYWITHRHDAERAKRLKAEASMQQVSLKEQYWGAMVPITSVENIAPMLTLLGAHPDAVKRTTAVAKTLPPSATLADLVMAMRAQYGYTETIAEGVCISTMHAAKGRQWQRVYLAAMEQSVTPSARQDTNLEEERRVVYVAVTRAKTELFISAAALRKMPYPPHRLIESLPSQFLTELITVPATNTVAA